MSDATNRFALPFLSSGQAQKEITHNEALALIDMLLHPAVEAVDIAIPPTSPSPGQAWLVPDQPSDDWVNQKDAIACWTQGGWRFVSPLAGMMLWVKNRATPAYYDGAQWQIGSLTAEQFVIGGKKIIGVQQGAIPAPVGGSIIDSESRAAVSAILNTLKSHGLIAAT